MSDLEDISLKLEARGYRVTPSRRAVVATILQQKSHFTADDLVSRCRGAGRATVFRTLRLLTELGVVCRVLMEDNSPRYLVSRRGQHHHHLVCTDCGLVQELEVCDVTDVLSEAASRSGYEIDGHWLELYGRCASCRNKTGAPA